MASVFKKHEQLYFADGNIVLVAKTAFTERIAFRAHQSAMARHSSVLADMLCLPTSNDAELNDGAPLVRMPDSAEDLERPLEVIYNQPMLRLKRFDPNTPLIVKPLLTLANKYEIHHLRAHIVQTLEEDWPQTLSEWDELEHYAEGKAETCRDLDDFLDLHLPEAASAIHLARHCNVPSIHPAAFYHPSRITIQNDWNKKRLE